ncbi:MAG: hypothetical protein AAF757_00400 [Cyanobacteria bacterium P01_D01_bin.116]
MVVLEQKVINLEEFEILVEYYEEVNGNEIKNKYVGTILKYNEKFWGNCENDIEYQCYRFLSWDIINNRK